MKLLHIRLPIIADPPIMDALLTFAKLLIEADQRKAEITGVIAKTPDCYPSKHQ